MIHMKFEPEKGWNLIVDSNKIFCQRILVGYCCVNTIWDESIY